MLAAWAQPADWLEATVVCQAFCGQLPTDAAIGRTSMKQKLIIKIGFFCILLSFTIFFPPDASKIF